MHLSSTSLADGQPIDPSLAFCQASSGGDHTASGGNRNPHLAWSGAPDGTRSFAIVMHDPDVPADAGDANTERKTIPAGAPRTDFYHWLVADIPHSTTEVGEGAASDGVTETGKSPGTSDLGVEGVNDFTSFLAGSPMAGTYGGYDGPCPPWNDERMHHYHITVYALDVETLGLDANGDFRGADVLDAIDGHILAQAEIVGTYTTNPAVG